MVDPIKEIYDLLCYHLGEKDKRGNIRLEDKHQPLASDITNFMQDILLYGKVEGKKELVEQLKASYNEADTKLRVEQFQTHNQRKFISRAGKAEEGYALRQGAVNEEKLVEST